jgi:hypothetical protein
MAKKTLPGAADPTVGRPDVISLADAAAIRKAVGLGVGEGPSPERIQRAVQAYVEEFDRWYVDQWDRILKLYVKRVVRRANPYVRRAQHGDCTPAVLAAELVSDWDSRNFVTAGGWAMEAMAIELGQHCRKAAAEGVDIELCDPAEPSSVSLYVIKSGSVTRNTDIVGKMKDNLRAAEARLRQNKKVKHVTLNYATCVGTLATTFADGVRRPSSAAFWAEITGTEEERAMALVWAVASKAAESIVRPTRLRDALIAQVATYVAREDAPGRVDWEFLVRIVSEPPRTYVEEHKARDASARAAGAKVMDPKAA